MKIKFLGTGTSMGVPVVACKCNVCMSNDPRDKRLRSSVKIELNGLNIVIDAGPDFRTQALRADITMVDALLLTHEHRDHIAGLDDIRSFNYLSGKPMDIYCESRVAMVVRNVFDYSFRTEKYPGIPEMNLINIENKAFLINNTIEVLPIRVMHSQLPVFGYRINDFAYITDLNYISDEEKKKIIGVNTLVVSGLRKKTHISHYTMGEAINLIQEIKPKLGLITHISDQLGKHAEIELELPPNIRLAYDDLEIISND